MAVLADCSCIRASAFWFGLLTFILIRIYCCSIYDNTWLSSKPFKGYLSKRLVSASEPLHNAETHIDCICSKLNTASSTALRTISSLCSVIPSLSEKDPHKHQRCASEPPRKQFSSLSFGLVSISNWLSWLREFQRALDRPLIVHIRIVISA